MEGDVRRGPWWVLCVLGSACAQIVTGPSTGDAASWVGALPPDDAGDAPMDPAGSCDPGAERSALLARCGVGDRAAGDTFSCTGGSDPALRCAANTQYCEQANDPRDAQPGSVGGGATRGVPGVWAFARTPV